ncbi:type II and III secretion system protein family protein [Sphingomonas sp.]|uniref:type II and III secretion system protein family protein n=1 Tax=Sphingomonas sp. TaxID=28214 RepID=UPI0025F3010B|nr:type II and III secretion system protein family protein [Sphingomonas sp.]MBV9527468.1 type II and III secretion system protein family protein [Sphingomonas sp.]
MKTQAIIHRAKLGTALAGVAIAIAATVPAAPAAAQPLAYTSGAYRPSTQVLLSIGEGQMLNLPRSVASVWTSNPGVADVFVNSPHQLNLYGKASGQATVIATAADGSVVYGANVRVSQNVSNVNEVLHAAMPDANIMVTSVGQVAVLNGTVASPADAAQAETLVTELLNPGKKPGDALDIQPVNRLKVATPLQVTLKVRIAEVNRSLLKKIGVNLLSTDNTGGFNFGVAQGGGIYLPPPGGDGKGAGTVIRNALGSTLQASGKLFGLNLLGTLDLAQTDGLVSTLAEPTLTALSGETASFLAGGEFPIPISQGNQAISIEYKQYGVGLAFTPVVLADGRISMRVRPEVSELSDAGSVDLNGYKVPALTTRRAETTVELGSGQSFMIGGLLQNHNSNSINKAPFLGDLPILGTLFRSTSYQRDETELVIVVTPYLVRPVSNHMALPTDGYRAPTDPQQFLEGQTFTGVSGTPVAVAPGPGIAGAAAVTAAPAPGFKL